MLGLFGIKKRKLAAVIPMTAQSVYARMRDDGMILFDVREPQEWRAMGIPEGAIGIALRDADFLEKLKSAVDGDLARPVCFICLHGSRSVKGAMQAHDSGFTDIYHLDGGLNGWKDADLPVTMPD